MARVVDGQSGCFCKPTSRQPYSENGDDHGVLGPCGVIARPHFEVDYSKFMHHLHVYALHSNIVESQSHVPMGKGQFLNTGALGSLDQPMLPSHREPNSAPEGPG
jgi:hypothetical protein